MVHGDQDSVDSEQRGGVGQDPRGGGLAALGALAEGWFALALIVVPVMFTGIYSVYFSYSEYQKLDVGCSNL